MYMWHPCIMQGRLRVKEGSRRPRVASKGCPRGPSIRFIGFIGFVGWRWCRSRPAVKLTTRAPFSLSLSLASMHVACVSHVHVYGVGLRPSLQGSGLGAEGGGAVQDCMRYVLRWGCKARRELKLHSERELLPAAIGACRLRYCRP